MIPTCNIKLSSLWSLDIWHFVDVIDPLLSKWSNLASGKKKKKMVDIKHFTEGLSFSRGRFKLRYLQQHSATLHPHLVLSTHTISVFLVMFHFKVYMIDMLQVVVERYMDKMSLFLLPDGSTPLFSFHHFIFIKLVFCICDLQWMNKAALRYLHYLLLLQKLWSGNPQINQHKYSINLFRVHTPQSTPHRIWADPRPRGVQHRRDYQQCH